MAEKLVRDRGAVPATVGILDGAIRVGLKRAELELLAKRSDILKVSRKDLSFAVSKRITGATTVSGTMAVAHMVGIKVFATGGIGGVHRDILWKVKRFSVSFLEIFPHPSNDVVCYTILHSSKA